MSVFFDGWKNGVLRSPMHGAEGIMGEIDKTLTFVLARLVPCQI
jgi:hypothetical protein